MDEEAIERIPFVYGAVVIISSILFFQLVNFLIRYTCSAAFGLSSSSSSWRTLNTNWKNRNIAVSWLHAVIVGISNLICIYIYFDELKADLIEYHNFFIYALTAISTGYFLHDFIDIVSHEPVRNQWEILLHHVVVSIAFFVNVYQCRFLGYIAVALLAEANSIFLHLRKLFHFFRVSSGHWTYIVVVSMNLFTFVSCRFLCIGWIAYGITVYNDKFHLLHWLLLAPSTAIMACINSVLFWRLISTDVLRHNRYRNGVKHTKAVGNGSGSDNNNRTLNGVKNRSFGHED